MSDVAAVYVLTTPGGAITFNDVQIGDGQDGYYLTDVRGLGQAPRRTPRDKRPQADGGIVHPRLKDARVVNFDGLYLVQSTKVESSIVQVWNQLEEDLIDALDTLVDADDGDLDWTPQGLSPRHLDCTLEVPLEPQWQPGFKTFSFALVAGNPDWT